MFQIFTHLSKDPVAKYFPSGLKATEQTGSVCRDNVCMHSPLSTSHKRTVESKLALANIKFEFGLLVPGPVGLHLIVQISLAWACKLCTHESCESVQILKEEEKFLKITIFILFAMVKYVYFKCHIVRTRGQQSALWVPFYSVYFILMPLKCFYWHLRAQFAHMDLLIGTTRCKAYVTLPIDV